MCKLFTELHLPTGEVVQKFGFLYEPTETIIIDKTVYKVGLATDELIHPNSPARSILTRKIYLQGAF